MTSPTKETVIDNRGSLAFDADKNTIDLGMRNFEVKNARFENANHPTPPRFRQCFIAGLVLIAVAMTICFCVSLTRARKWYRIKQCK